MDLLWFPPDLLINEVDDTDLIIIPPMAGNMQEGISANKSTIDWIISQHQKGSEVASLCVGAFLLASTGLVNGKNVRLIGDLMMNLERCFQK